MTEKNEEEYINNRPRYMCRNNHGCHGNISPRRAYRLRNFLSPDAQMIYPTYTPPTPPTSPYITYPTPYKKQKKYV